MTGGGATSRSAGDEEVEGTEGFLNLWHLGGGGGTWGVGLVS